MKTLLSIRFTFIAHAMIGLFMIASLAWGEAKGPLKANPDNPRYFTDGDGNIVYLTGSHTWSNLQDQGVSDPPPVFDYDGYLDLLVENNHNFIRLWVWEQARWAPWSDAKEGRLTFPVPMRPGLLSTACHRIKLRRT